MTYTSNDISFEVLRYINATLDRRQRGYAWKYIAYLKGDGSEPDGRGTPDAEAIRDHLWPRVLKDGSALRFHDGGPA